MPLQGQQTVSSGVIFLVWQAWDTRSCNRPCSCLASLTSSVRHATSHLIAGGNQQLLWQPLGWHKSNTPSFDRG
jgi:hypothetical protein